MTRQRLGDDEHRRDRCDQRRNPESADLQCHGSIHAGSHGSVDLLDGEGVLADHGRERSSDGVGIGSLGADPERTVAVDDLIAVTVVECGCEQHDPLGIVGDVLGAPVDPGDLHVDLRSAVLLDGVADEGGELIGGVRPQGDPIADSDSHLPLGLLVDRDFVRCRGSSGAALDDVRSGRRRIARWRSGGDREELPRLAVDLVGHAHP